jgi:hypothetical protein
VISPKDAILKKKRNVIHLIFELSNKANKACLMFFLAAMLGNHGGMARPAFTHESCQSLPQHLTGQHPEETCADSR